MTTTTQTFSFSLPLGANKEQALNVLKAIKESMSDVLWQASAVDCSANDETVYYARKIYREAKNQLRSLKVS